MGRMRDGGILSCDVATLRPGSAIRKAAHLAGLEPEPRPGNKTEVFSTVDCSETQSPSSRCTGK